jgi:hypothetical protein
MYAALTLLLFSCRQPIDLDTDRTIVATNLPEITDFTPKTGWLGDRIIITGKNFVDVQKVMLDTLTLDSVVVESPSRISAHLPDLSIATAPMGFKFGQRTVSVTTKIHTALAQAKSFVYARGVVVGKVSIENQLLDSVIFHVVNQTYNSTDFTTSDLYPFGKGWYSITYSSLFAGTANTTEDLVIQPFKSGYSFLPPTRSVRTLELYKALGEEDFEAKRISSEQLPSVTSISPNFGKSFSGSTETGTDIALQGKGLLSVRKIIIVGPSYAEATTFRVENDTQITVRLPRFDRLKALSGRTYTNCQVYLLLENGSYLAPQRISITYI